jgi:hypothetical protein
VLLIELIEARVESVWQLEQSGPQSSGAGSLSGTIDGVRAYSEPFESC